MVGIWINLKNNILIVVNKELAIFCCFLIVTYLRWQQKLSLKAMPLKMVMRISAKISSRRVSHSTTKSFLALPRDFCWKHRPPKELPVGCKSRWPRWGESNVLRKIRKNSILQGYLLTYLKFQLILWSFKLHLLIILKKVSKEEHF